MAFQDAYRQQVALLIRTIPFVAQEQCFALKGGTAINLFVRDLPRLSVDIDLTYLPVEDRASSLNAIDAAMMRIKERIEGGIPGAAVAPSRSAGDNIITKLIVRSEGVQIKIEVTPVLRGTVYDPVVMSVVPTVEDTFGFAEMQVVSFADLYAGKIVATLDRQHPRDLFDVRDLLANEGISDELRRAFLVYLISHNRPMAEVLAPTHKPLAEEFERGFVGIDARGCRACRSRGYPRGTRRHNGWRDARRAPPVPDRLQARWTGLGTSRHTGSKALASSLVEAAESGKDAV